MHNFGIKKSLLLFCLFIISGSYAYSAKINCTNEVTKPPGPSPNEKFKLGYCQYATGDFANAANTFNNLDRELPLLMDYINYYQANSFKELKNYNNAEMIYRKIAFEFPSSSLRKKSMIELAELYNEQAKYPEAIALYQELLNSEKSEWEKSKYENAIGEILIKQKNLDGAFEIYKNIWYTYPQSTSSIKVHEVARSKGTQFVPTQSERLIRANKLFELESWNNAYDELSLLPPSGDTELKKAISLYKTGRYEEALSTFNSLRGPEPQYWKGKTLQRLGRFKQAREAYLSVHQQYPNTEFAAEGLYSAAKLELRNLRYTNAENYYNILITNYPNFADTPDAAWSLGWIYYSRGQFPQALDIFSRYSYPGDSFNSQSFPYWKAKTLEKMGRTSDAFNIYESIAYSPKFTYHSFLSRTKVNHSPKVFKMNPSAGTFSQNIKKQKADLLISLGLYDPALIEIEELEKVSSSDGELIVVSNMYKSVGNNYKSVTLLEKIDNPAALPFKFPQPHSDQVYKYSTKYGLDVLLVYSLIREESRFNEYAVSSSNARGLMQLIRGTANDSAREVGRYPFNFDMLFDPDVNVELGSFYLRKVLNRYNGEIPLGLASYNAGPGRVSEWVDEIGYYNYDEFIEQIPITETRNYVKRILRSYGAYNALYRN